MGLFPYLFVSRVSGIQTTSRRKKNHTSLQASFYLKKKKKKKTKNKKTNLSVYPQKCQEEVLLRKADVRHWASKRWTTGK